jgi:hypothetical protein
MAHNKDSEEMAECTECWNGLTLDVKSLQKKSSKLNQMLGNVLNVETHEHVRFL